MKTMLNSWGRDEIGANFADDIFKWIFLEMYEFRLRFH